MIDRLIEIERCYGVEMNVEKETKVMRISRQPSPIQIIIDQKQLENVEYFKYLSSMITNDARCTREIKSRIAMAKAAFNRKKNLFTSKLDLNLRNQIVKSYVSPKLSNFVHNKSSWKPAPEIYLITSNWFRGNNMSRSKFHMDRLMKMKINF
jgi:hypothetical protein